MHRPSRVGDIVFDVQVLPASNRFYTHTYLGLSGAEAIRVRETAGAANVSIQPRVAK